MFFLNFSSLIYVQLGPNLTDVYSMPRFMSFLSLHGCSNNYLLPNYWPLFIIKPITATHLYTVDKGLSYNIILYTFFFYFIIYFKNLFFKMDCRVILQCYTKGPVVALEKIKLHLYINSSIMGYQNFFLIPSHLYTFFIWGTSRFLLGSDYYK